MYNWTNITLKLTRLKSYLKIKQLFRLMFLYEILNYLSTDFGLSNNAIKIAFRYSTFIRIIDVHYTVQPFYILVVFKGKYR